MCWWLLSVHEPTCLFPRAPVLIPCVVLNFYLNPSNIQSNNKDLVAPLQCPYGQSKQVYKFLCYCVEIYGDKIFVPVLNSNCRYQASYGEEEVNLLRQEVSNLKARLQRTGTPHRESPGVGAGADEQVIKFDHRVCGIHILAGSLAV